MVSPIERATIEIGELAIGGLVGPLAYLRRREVSIAPPGHTETTTWAALAGATEVEVEPIPYTIEARAQLTALGELLVAPAGAAFDISIPGGVPLRSLTLRGLRASGGPLDLRSEADLINAGRRLVVATVSGGQVSAPLYSVPVVRPGGMAPASLTGASYDSGVLTLPDLAAGKIRLSLVSGATVDKFVAEGMTLSGATGIAALLPRDLTLVDSDDAPTWQVPGTLPLATPAATVDLRTSATKMLEARLKADQPLTVAFTLRGAAAGLAGIDYAGVHGYLVRRFAGITTVQLEGGAQPLPLTGLPLADEAPATAVADLTVRYLGLRVLEEVSDALPPAAGAGGSIVTAEPVLRHLPPALLRAQTLVRIGLIGRAPVATELSVQPVATAGGAGRPLGAPGVVQLEPTSQLAVIWVTLRQPLIRPTEPVAIAVRANTGRFLWAAAPQPLLRLVVADPDPGGRPVLLAGRQLVEVTADERHQVAFALPPAAFQSAAPLVASALFVRVDLSDLTLRYRR